MGRGADVRVGIAGAVVVVSLALGGCGDAAPVFDEQAATEEVGAGWETWFDASVPFDDKVHLIEFGEELREATEQAGQNPAAAGLNVVVQTVEFNEARDQAEVTYDLRNGEQVLLPGVNGLAVLVDGTWKVSALSYCELLALGGTFCPEEVRDGSVASFERQ